MVRAMEQPAAGKQARNLEAAIGAAIARAREHGEREVADDLARSLDLVRSRRPT